MRFKPLLLAGLVSFAAPAFADEGMWTFDNFPADAVKAKHGVTIDQKWLDIAKKFPLGSAATLNSPQDIQTAIINGYSVLDGCSQYIGNGSIRGSGAGGIPIGTCSITVSSLSVGTRSVTARYVGDQNYATSSSATTFVTISATSTSTTLASSANPAGLGRTVRLTATVSPSITVGTIRFLDAGIELGTCSLSDGTCAFEIGTLSAGTHSTGTAARSRADPAGPRTRARRRPRHHRPAPEPDRLAR